MSLLVGAHRGVRRPRTATPVRSLALLAALTATLPVDLAATGLALARSARRPPPRARPTGITVLVSGGKMTKSLALARAFHAAGHRVVLVESAKYRFTGHRFSRAVDAFHVVPEPTDPAYAEALRGVVRAEGVDVYVPVCSPAASRYDADATALLSPHCEVLHVDPDQVRMLDDKHAFAVTAAALGLGVPDTHLVTDPAQVLDFDFPAGQTWIVKSLAYDPVARLDLTRLPLPSRAETESFLAGKAISADRPWILQEYVEGQEYCTHSTVRDGRIQVWACCASSAFQVNYAMSDQPAIRAWVERFVGAQRLTGQVSFDFILRPDGRPVAIECNPRTHSAITMFAGHPALGRAYLSCVEEAITPLPGSRPTYWTYHELWRLLRNPRDWRVRLAVLREGTDAIFDVHDPVPYLLEHHLQIPWLLVRSLWHGGGWSRVDFNIGKLVEAGGD